MDGSLELFTLNAFETLPQRQGTAAKLFRCCVRRELSND
jgi:hypothetical protein